MYLQKELLCQVIDEQVANEREALIQKAKEIYNVVQ